MGFLARARRQSGDEKSARTRGSAVSVADLCALCGGRVIPGGNGAAVSITGVSDDSRQIKPGDVFVATRGRQVDGHSFATAAVQAGAVLVVGERAVDELPVPQLVVADAVVALAQISAKVAGHPAEALTMVGITGTNGKTTTSYAVEAILRQSGLRPGVIGTVVYRFDDGRETAAPYTTPTAPLLHQTLGRMRDGGCRSAVLEVSSAALDMGRLHEVSFAVAAFTNLTQDHLDLHGSFGAYRAAKAKLFGEHLAADGVAVVNVDDDNAQAMIDAAGHRRVLRVSTADRDADVYVAHQETSVAGIRAAIKTPRGSLLVQSSHLFGGYNVGNVALAVAVGEALGLDLQTMEEAVGAMAGVPGRVERVDNERGVDVFVDYAHTPDALANVLAAMRPLTAHRLMVVFGCGGDRDPGKRPMMGKAADDLADLAFVTSDNPRTEDPQRIIDEVTAAMDQPFFVHCDRRVAITAAVDEARPGDVVVIAGKGHEDYQILGKDKVDFDDRLVAAAALATRWTFPAADVAAVVCGKVRRGRSMVAATEFDRVVIDSRGVRQGDLYVAIVGERHDGHDFCQAAVEAGARGLIVGRDRSSQLGKLASNVVVFEVDDPRTALGSLARFHRRRWGRLLIGVTGSAGKTSTKDLCAAVLATERPVLATQGSLNNETGVPLTLLGLRRRHGYAVIEMGMRGEGK